MDLSRCKNDTQRGHIRNIEEFGVSILSVAPRMGDKGPMWTYSIGFWQEYDHPEVILIGLNRSTAAGVINEMNRLIRDGVQSFRDETSSVDLLSGDYTCYFKTVEPGNYGDFVLGNNWFYGDESFPVVQLIWPDMDRTFPWNENADTDFVSCQPLLCSLPKRALH
jgi:hypothetical protein